MGKMTIEQAKEEMPNIKFFLQIACDSGVNNKMKYCDQCGQKLDWSDEAESQE